MSESRADPFISMIPISNHDGSLLDPSLANHKLRYQASASQSYSAGSIGELVNLLNMG